MRHNNLTMEKAFVSLTLVFVLSTSFTYTVKANDFDDNYEYDYELYNSLSELEQKDKKVLEKYRLQWQQEVFKLQDMATQFENRPIRKLKLKPKHQNNNE